MKFCISRWDDSFGERGGGKDCGLPKSCIDFTLTPSHSLTLHRHSSSLIVTDETLIIFRHIKVLQRQHKRVGEEKGKVKGTMDSPKGWPP